MGLSYKEKVELINKKYLEFKVKINKLNMHRFEQLVEYRKRIDKEKLKRLREGEYPQGGF